MTIYPAQKQSEEKKELLTVEFPSVFILEEKGEQQYPPPYAEIVQALPRPRHEQRRRVCLHICLFLMVASAVTAGVMGGIYIWKRYHLQQYSGWCGVRVTNAQSIDGAVSLPIYVDEHVDVDLSAKMERISVPSFSNVDEATFLHDFNKNLTAISDFNKTVCYVLPLDRETTPQPETFLDILRSLLSGALIPDAEEIQAHYRIVFPPVRDVNTVFGRLIDDLCAGFTTYRLVKLPDSKVLPHNHTTYGAYSGGPALVRYNVYNSRN